MKKTLLRKFLFLILAVNFNNIAFAQYAQWLTTDPIYFYKSFSALEEESRAKKFHVQSVTLVDHKEKIVNKDTTFEPDRFVYTMTFSETGNILTEGWTGQVTRYYYNKNDLLYKKISSTKDSTLFYYNFDKKLVYVRHYSMDSSLWSTIYAYDPDGKLLNEKTYRIIFSKKDEKRFRGDSTYCGSYDWTYDERGRILQLRQDSPFDIIKSAVFNYNYFENGNIKVTELTSYKFESIYDSSGNELSDHSFFECDACSYEFQRDEYGSIVTNTTFRKNKSNDVSFYQNSYNSAGLLTGYIETTSFSPDIVHVWKITYTFYK
jgi:hypothetical protein